MATLFTLTFLHVMLKIHMIGDHSVVDHLILI